MLTGWSERESALIFWSELENKMKAEFYDVKTREKIQADVTEKVTFGKGNLLRYALRAKTSDGRNLTRFVSKADWDKASV